MDYTETFHISGQIHIFKESFRILLSYRAITRTFPNKITSNRVMPNYYRRSHVLKIPQGGRYKIKLYFIFMRNAAIPESNFGGIDYHI